MCGQKGLPKMVMWPVCLSSAGMTVTPCLQFCCYRNAKRVAEVWLGDHKRFFYESQPNARALDAGR